MYIRNVHIGQRNGFRRVADCEIFLFDWTIYLTLSPSLYHTTLPYTLQSSHHHRPFFPLVAVIALRCRRRRRLLLSLLHFPEDES